MDKTFRVEEFLELNNSEKFKYLNSFSNDKLVLIFDSISLAYTSFLDEKHLIMLLSDFDVKKRIISLVSSFYCGETTFNNILRKMTSKVFISFMDDETFKYIIELPRKDIVINAIIHCENQNILNALPQTKLMEYLIYNYTKMNHIFENIEEPLACFIFDYVVKKYPNMINIIINFNSKNQLSVINHFGPYNFYNVIKDKLIFLYLEDDVITMLIDKEPFFTYFLNLDIKDIIMLINRGVIIPEKFTYSRNFIDKFSRISDVNEYRFILNKILDNSFINIKRHKWRKYTNNINYMLSINSQIDNLILKEYETISGILPIKYFEELYSSEYLEHSREKYYDHQVNLILSCDNLLIEYYDEYLKHPENYEMYYEFTTTKLLEILIDRYFKDIPYNFLINLRNVVEFFESINMNSNNLIKHLDMYIKILNFYNLSRVEQLNLYNSFDKNVDYASIFYDDFNQAKNIAYNKYNEVVFNVKRDKHLINDELSSKYDVPIYEFKGEPFYLYAHITSIKRDEVIKLPQVWESRIIDYLEDPFIDEFKTSGTSLSLSSSTKLETFRSVLEYVSYGFCHLEPNRIAHVYHSDSYSAYYNRGVGMEKINELLMPDDLLKKTCKYNEILYQEISPILLDYDVRKKYIEFRPDYLLCYDEINLWDLYISRELEIPILVIYTEYYNMEKLDYDMYRRTNEYVNNLSELRRIKTYRKK